MGDHAYEADPGAIVGCGNRLAQLQTDAANIIELAADANPEWYIWGLIGAPFAQGYWSVAEDVYSHLEKMGESLKSQARTLEANGKAYHAAEEAIAKSLRDLHQLLD